MTLAELQTLVLDIGEPRFRATQLYRWLYDKGVRSFDEMSNLPKTLRQRLGEVSCIGALKVVRTLISKKDKSVKYLFALEDGLTVESVLMFEDKRATLCVSTQVGCAVDCKFCATGMMGLKRNLTVGEIVDQFLSARSLSGKSISNVVFMGMGEPFHNYERVIAASEILTSANGPGLGKRRLVISTSGIVSKIYRFADEGQPYRLAISLNATDDATRTRLMPLNKKWPLAELKKAVLYYTEKAKQQVTFEYVLLQGINDSPEDARRLKKIVQGVFCKLNLIPYNTTLGDYQRPTEARVLGFYRQLAGLDVPVMIRWSKGDDIRAGCGQLAGEAKQN